MFSPQHTEGECPPGGWVKNKNAVQDRAYTA